MLEELEAVVGEILPGIVRSLELRARFDLITLKKAHEECLQALQANSFHGHRPKDQWIWDLVAKPILYKLSLDKERLFALLCVTREVSRMYLAAIEDRLAFDLFDMECAA